jgi:hypothetical protein
MLDTVYSHVQLQTFEALVLFDVLKRLLEGGFGCIAWEGLEDGIGAGFADLGDRGID